MARPFSLRSSHRDALLALVLGACSSASDAPRRELIVQTDGEGLEEVTTDLGYLVRVTTARLRVEDVQFAQAGESHVAHSPWRPWRDLFCSTAHAHPDHYQGGEITGELSGSFVLDFLAGPGTLGTATLIAGPYESANFTLGTASGDDGLDADDPLIGHTALLAGTARKDGEEFRFNASIDSPAGRQIVGVPFELRVGSATDDRLVLRLMSRDQLEQDTLFDGLDFAALADASGAVELSAEQQDELPRAAYEQLKRTLQTHDHFQVAVQTKEP